MTLPEKLDQLSLATMSRQLETTLSEAATKNLSVAATLEWLADMELEARNHRAIERRFKCSRLQAQPSIDGFHFQHHKSRLPKQKPHPASSRSRVSAQGNQPCVHWESGSRQNLSIENHWLAHLPGQSADLVHHRHGHVCVRSAC